MLLSEAIEALLVATIADGRSERTVGDYEQKLSGLLNSLGDVEVASITTQDLRTYIAGLRARSDRWESHPYRAQKRGRLSEASIAAYIRALKRLFNFLAEEELIPSNPAKRIRLLKPRRGEPKGISKEDLGRLLEATEGQDPNLRKARAVVTFLADTGCRVGGLVGLRLEDLDLEAGRAWLEEKGRRRRVVFFSGLTRQALEAWLEVRLEGSPYVFNSLADGTQVAPQAIRDMLRRLAKRAGCTGPTNPHSFRHGFAREYLLNGGDLGSLADILGHADVQTTWQSYAIFRTAELAEKHARHSPISRLGREG